MIKKIGIECEQLEGERFGVGHMLAQFLHELSNTPRIDERFKIVLYFKNTIPKDKFLNHPVFEKKVIRFPFLPPSFNIFYHILIPFYYLKDKLDLFFFPSYMLPAFFMGNSVVVLTNDVYYEAHFGTLPYRYRLSYKLFCKWAAMRATKIMTISEFSKKELMKFYKIPEDRIFVDYWGVDRNQKSIGDGLEEIHKIKEKLGIKKDYIVSVGQAFERRNVKEAMLAFQEIADEFPDVQYLVACRDKYRSEILDTLAESINQELGRKAIIKINYIEREDMFFVLKYAKALLYVSEKEALGLPPLEALLERTPAIIKDNELGHEIFGDNAFFVKNAKDTDEFAESIKAALKDMAKAEEIALKKEEILEKFDWQKHTKKLLEEFSKIH